MSDEILYSVKLALSNGSLSDSYSSSNLRADQSLARLVRNTQPIPNTPTALDMGDVITPGMSIFANMSTVDTDIIEVGNYTGGTFYPLVELKYGEQAVFRVGISGSLLYAQSNTASGAILFYIIYND